MESVEIVWRSRGSSAPGVGEARAVPGTPLFASWAAHVGEVALPRDDIESLCYSLAYCAQGTLPWSHLPNDHAASLKRQMLTDGCSILTDRGREGRRE